jgi:hypothetical protein
VIPFTSQLLCPNDDTGQNRWSYVAEADAVDDDDVTRLRGRLFNPNTAPVAVFSTYAPSEAKLATYIAFRWESNSMEQEARRQRVD